MELKDKLPTIPEDEQLKLLETDGMLVKCPLVIGADFVLVGNAFKVEINTVYGKEGEIT